MSTIEAIKMQIAQAETALANAEKNYHEVEHEFMQAKDAKIEAFYELAELKENLRKEELAAAELAAALAALVRPVGTKYKWTHKTNPETYRVAIQTKNGILQVKAATDGRLHVHEECTCGPCWEFEHNAPWRPKKPLQKTFFADLDAWHNTLPEYQGKLATTSAPITDKALKALCMKPLEATEDALQLKELEQRFPGGVFVLSTTKTQFEISYKRVADAYDQIYYAKINMSFFNFSDYCGQEKIQLLVDWRGLYIDLSHLFQLSS
jgi:DNA repair exonuclease SbcCD ATPase subunit